MPESYDDAVAASKKYDEDYEKTYGQTDSAEEARQQIKASALEVDKTIEQTDLIDNAMKPRVHPTYGLPNDGPTNQELLDRLETIIEKAALLVTTGGNRFSRSYIIKFGAVYVTAKMVGILGEIAIQRFGKK